MRAAIYARYSTDNQSPMSIEDQIDLCQAFAAREQLTVCVIHYDRARSGGSMIGRDGLDQVMRAAEAGTIDCVVVESLDRLSRDIADLATIYKKLKFLNIPIRGVHEGKIDTVTVGLRGLVGQLFREDTAKKTRRGQAGRVRKGFSAGGLAYGYATVLGKPGELAIDEGKAAIVRRIHEEYAKGSTARDIAHRLNLDHIPGPRGGKWNASTINGSASRENGILLNPIYSGKLVWGRLRMVVDPKTGKRISRNGDADDRMEIDAPHLAIVPTELLERVATVRKERVHQQPHEYRKRRYLLTGLLRCGACGSGMVRTGKDKSGRVRTHCSGHRERGDCPSPSTFYIDVIERTVIDALRDEMRHPRVISEYVKEYHAEWTRLTAGAREQKTRDEGRLKEIDAQMGRLVDAIASGGALAAAVSAKAEELAAERRKTVARLEAASDQQKVIELHPAALTRYEEQLGRLAEALTPDSTAVDQDASAAMQELIEFVTVSRGEDGRPCVRITGRLMALLEGNRHRSDLSGVLKVAGEGFEPPTRGL